MTHVASRLYEEIGPDAYDAVARWLRDVANEHALEMDGVVMSPSVGWLAEAMTFYQPPDKERDD